MRWTKSILLILITLISSCIDPFVPETASYDDILFIECLISDHASVNPSLSISRSVPLRTEDSKNTTSQPEKITGAFAKIVRDDGTQFQFEENLPGIYRLTGNFEAEAGRSYQLVVNYSNQTYESVFETLIPSPPIDGISFRHELARLTEDGIIQDGYRFTVSTHDDRPGPSFYRWVTDATFFFRVPYTATHIWDGRTTIPETNKHLMACWKSKSINGLFIADTRGLSLNRIVDAPLNFESQNGDELTIRYSLNVTQLTLSESAYRFWENIDKLINRTGGLYETQPFRIEGNIRCVSDTTLYVAGIFEVAGVSQARIFVDRPTEFDVYPVKCYQDTVGTMSLPWYILPPGTFVTQDAESGAFLTSSPSCYDCRERGGTLEKPPFWDYIPLMIK